MHVGIYIEAFDDDLTNLWEYIIRKLSVQGSSWFVDCLDCVRETQMHNDCFYSTETLLAYLRQNPSIFFARMISIPAGASLDRNIETYEDYRMSKCQSIVLCVDGGYFAIYSKEGALLNELMRHPANIDIETLEWIDENNDGTVERYCFVV